MSSVQSLYQQALKYAATKHTEAGQVVPGTNYSYVVHVCNVAMEIMVAEFHTKCFNLDLALPVALLHDLLEDTNSTPEELEQLFGKEVRRGVQALTKDKSLPEDKQMDDCLKRIKLLSREIWAVKLADRITNLQSPPPQWDEHKKINYQKEAGIILGALGEGNDYLAERLKNKIDEYSRYI
jgi:guanosine-3',5'-bis(diphosphate) 3'-pyrophosphohydrolase